MPVETKKLPPKPGKENLLVPMGRGRPRKNPDSIKEATQGMKGREIRTGFLGKGDMLHKPDVLVVEKLDAEGIERKRVIREQLIKFITPNSLSSKSTPEMDRRSLVSKLNRLTLEELEEFLPPSVASLTTNQLKEVAGGQSSIDEADAADIQTNYLNLSP